MSIRVPSRRAPGAHDRPAGIAALAAIAALVAGLWIAALAPTVAAASQPGATTAAPAAQHGSVADLAIPARHAGVTPVAAVQAQRHAVGGGHVLTASQKGGISLRLVAVLGVVALVLVFAAGGLFYWVRSRR